MKPKALIRGLCSYIPNLKILQRRATGGTSSARYCYSIWVRHLVMAQRSGLDVCPRSVAELGPGDSIGIGLAALISGAEEYAAFDVVRFANSQRNLDVFEELVSLFRSRSKVPGDDEWPKVRPRLEKYGFPHDVFSEARMEKALDYSRLDWIRKAIKNPGLEGSPIRYMVPWYERSVIRSESVDMIFSQAVLEHVDDLEGAYQAMNSWLKPGGYMSHAIDFSSHGTADEWNGHWRYSDFVWRLIRGKQVYLINRMPLSSHLELMQRNGFKLVLSDVTREQSRHEVGDLAPRFRSMLPSDLVSRGAFIQVIKETGEYTTFGG